MKADVRFIEKVLAVGMAVLCVFAVAGCSGDGSTEQNQGLTKLTAVYPSGPALIPLYFQSAIALDLGYWKDEGLDVEVVGVSGGSASAIQQLVASNGDVSNESPQVVFDAIEEGFGDDLRIFGTWLYEQPFSVRTYEDSDINSVEDLAGKTIGVSDPAGGEVTLLNATLAEHGVTDYKILPIGDGSAQTIRALNARQVDAYSTASKDFLGIDAQGVKLKNIDIPEWEHLTANVFTARTDFLNENRGAVVGYLRGLAKATAFAFANPEAAVKITMKYQEAGVSEDLVRGWIDQTLSQSVPLPLIEAGTPFKVAEPELQDFFDFYKRAGAIRGDANITVSDYVDDGVVEEAGKFDLAKIQEQAKTYMGN